MPSPSPESPPAEAAAARTPAPVAWEIPSPSRPRRKPVQSPRNQSPSKRARRRAVAGADGTPPREKDTPARLLDDARAFAFDVSLVDLVDEAEAMLREEEEEEDEEEDTRTRGGATNHKPPSPRTGDTKRRASGARGVASRPPVERILRGSSKGSRASWTPCARGTTTSLAGCGRRRAGASEKAGLVYFLSELLRGQGGGTRVVRGRRAESSGGCPRAPLMTRL